MAKKEKFVNITHSAGRPAYTKVISQIIKDGVCPFCPTNFLKYHTRPILRDGKHWLVTENMNPYEGSKHQFLFVHKKHLEDISKLSPTAWAELLQQIRWVEKKFKLPGGGFFMRFGDTHYTGASVTHLHAQMIIGVRHDKKSDPIAAVLAYKKK